MDMSVITPQGVTNHKEVDRITIPGSLGTFTILKGHAPLISKITKGKINFRTNNNTEEIEVENGIVEVKNNTVRLFMEQSEK